MYRNGELYAWGCTGGGRLGVGWRRKQLQETPARVVPHWADPSVSAAAGTAAAAAAAATTTAAAAAAANPALQYGEETFDGQPPIDRIYLPPVSIIKTLNPKP